MLLYGMVKNTSSMLQVIFYSFFDSLGGKSVIFPKKNLETALNSMILKDFLIINTT